MVVGYYAGIQCAARYGLATLNMAVNRQLPNGARDQGLSLMSDNGWQPTAVAFMQACRLLGSKQAFTSFNHPKGNADTKRFMRTRKEACLWLQEWTSPFGLISALDSWIETDNDHDLHSALG